MDQDAGHSAGSLGPCRAEVGTARDDVTLEVTGELASGAHQQEPQVGVGVRAADLDTAHPPAPASGDSYPACNPVLVALLALDDQPVRLAFSYLRSDAADGLAQRDVLPVAWVENRRLRRLVRLISGRGGGCRLPGLSRRG